MDAQIRNFREIKSQMFDDENYKTATSIEQMKVETLIERCYDRFEQLASMDQTLPYFYRKEHIRYLEQSLRLLSSSYECLDSSRPWMVYWILNSAHLLNFNFSKEVQADVVTFLTKCRHPTGGFGGGPGQLPHLAPTYAAVNALSLIETKESHAAIDLEGIKSFLWTVRESNGAFRMHVDGELDVRGSYCAVSVGRLSGISPNNRLFEGTANWIASTQTYEGGFGGTPGLEAHGGYSFCGAAALALLGTTSTVNLNSLLRWAVNRQMRYEGGFQGRTNKLVDGCYSFWQGCLVQVVQILIEKNSCDDGYTINIDDLLFHREALQEYILICCQKPNGGLLDKPGKPADLYHTCYTLSGLSAAQNFSSTKPPLIIGNPGNEVQMIHPLYNIAPTSVLKVYKYAQEHMKETKEELIGDNLGETNNTDNNGEDELEQETGITLVMSVYVRYSADNIGDDSPNFMNGSNSGSRSSSDDEMQMEHQGRLGTPDANANIIDAGASYLKSTDNFNTIQQQQQKQQQFLMSACPTLYGASTEDLFSKLHETLALEPKYQPNLFLSPQSNDGEITIGTRDGAAHVLRCLKVWYDLSNDVMFAAINLLDRFLTKMKVRPKHMACISVGSLHLAIKQLNIPQIDTDDLVVISQCRCTASDLSRMSDIIANKLGVQIGSPPVTGLTFIRLFYFIFQRAAAEMGLSDFYNSAIVLSDLESRMEYCACDASCASIRACELALVMLCTQMDAHVTSLNAGGNQQVNGLVDYAIQLQKLCRIPDSSFFHSHSTVVKILSMYSGEQRMPYKQRLVWKLSSRTLRSLRPTDKLKMTSYLPTIEEDNNNSRYRTGSMSSDDGSEDWPCSPFVPICEQC
ncbi:unnamed protein product [Diamesa hyperborea]